jgi:hypothetical protein
MLVLIRLGIRNPTDGHHEKHYFPGVTARQGAAIDGGRGF